MKQSEIRCEKWFETRAERALKACRGLGQWGAMEGFKQGHLIRIVL